MIELNGTKWSKYQGVLLPDEAPHKEITLTEQEQRFLLSQSRAYFVRWTSHWDCGQVTDFWHVVKDKPTNIEDYPTNTRRDIRRGLRKCSVSRVGPSVLAALGYEVYRRAFVRYETHLRLVTEAEYRRGFANPRPDADYWAAFVGDRLVGYSINYVGEGMCDYAAMKLDPEKLKDSCSYALLHAMNEYYLRTRQLRYVTDGTRSLAHTTHFQEFLIERFLFRKAYCQLHIVYAPWLKLPVQFIFPFRQIVSRIRYGCFRKLAVLLRHEEIRRTFG